MSYEMDKFGMTHQAILEELEDLKNPGRRKTNADWLKTRPEVVKNLAARFPSTQLYRFTGEGHCCVPTDALVGVASFRENGLVGVNILRSHIPGKALNGRHLVRPDELEVVDTKELTH